MREGDKQFCWLCERPLGRRVEQHHTVPKAKKGRDTVLVHPICHRTIHAHVSNARLVHLAGDRDSLLQIEEIAKFLRWIARKPPDFHATTRKPR